MIPSQLIKKARYLLSAEKKEIFLSARPARPARPDRSARPARPPGEELSICLVYPNTYYIGMSNLGFLTLYQILNSQPGISCERAFLPDREDLPEYYRTETPLFSLESKRPLREFHVIAFSLCFELDFLHVPAVLNLARIPLKSSQRDNCGLPGRLGPPGWLSPLVMAGGLGVYLNPEPLADFIDIFILGEGEEVLPEVAAACLNAVHEGLSRDESFRDLREIAGVYIPSDFEVIYNHDGTIAGIEKKGDDRGQKKCCQTARPARSKPLTRRWVASLDSYPTASSILTPNTEFKSQYLIEISRGCPKRCRFCVTSFATGPFRYRSMKVLTDQVKHGLTLSRRIGLVGAAVGDYPYLMELCAGIKSLGGRISLPSLPVKNFLPSLLNVLDQQTFTLAIETGSPALRQKIGKYMEEDEIIKTLELVGRQANIKLYLLIGLPGESMTDILDTVRLIKEIKTVMKRGLTLSINPFIPKPHTPWAREAMEEAAVLEERLRFMKKHLQGIRFTHKSLRLARYQTVISRGDRRLAKVLSLVGSQGVSWSKAFFEAGLEPEFYTRKITDPERVLPWEHLRIAECGMRIVE
ncbi:MAG: radical SAM protein [bacterium]|nr:radical SAM protein [bacterium]